MRRAKIAFFVVTGVAGLLAGTILSTSRPPIVGLLLGLVLGAVCGGVVAGVVYVWPVLRVFWHWSIELVVGGGLLYGWHTLATSVHMFAALAVVTLLAGVVGLVGPVRRRLVGWAWCVIVRHRLRVCFAAFIARSQQHGLPPLILFAKPTPAGERVWVWLRPGLSVREFEHDVQMSKLAVACWAKEVRITAASKRYAALVRFDITRRDPLVRLVGSPLPAMVPAGIPASNPPGLVGVPTGLDLPDVPAPQRPDRSESGRNRRSGKWGSMNANDRRIADTNGAADTRYNTGPGPDLSDYV